MGKEKQDNKTVTPKMFSIKWKLLCIIIPVVVLMVGILVISSYKVSKELLESTSHDLLELSVDNQANQIEAWMNENLASFKMAKRTIESTNPDEEQLQAMLDSYYGFNSNFTNGLYIADADGNLMKASQSDLTAGNVADSIWFKQGITRQNMAYTDSYQNDNGVNVVSASGILKDSSGKLKVISADLSIDKISIIVNSFIDMEGAQAFLVNKYTNEIIAHRNSELISTQLGANGDKYMSSLADKFNAGDFDFCSVNGNMTVFEEIDGTNWELVSYVPESLILSKITLLRNVMILIGAVAILILCLLIIRVVHMIIRPVKKLTSSILTMSSGDFTVEIDSNGNDEIAMMGQSVKKFTSSMRQMLHDIHTISDKLNEQAWRSDSISSELYGSAQTQATSMSELNTTVDQLSISVNEIAENATKLAMVVSDTHENSEHVDKKMQETVDISTKGRTDMQKIGKAMNEISESISKLNSAVDKVGEASDEITKIVALIGDIAEETNLLSLNASIEAARAGEMGKGFAVVAGQIGQLASNSTASVSNITTLIDEIRELVSDAVNQAGESSKNIDESSQLIYAAVETFDLIYKNIEETNDMIAYMINKVGEVDEVATTVAAISEEQAASSDEILATSENMVIHANSISDNSHGVADESKHLAETSEKLSQQVNTFKI